jgi:hypothetical protein
MCRGSAPERAREARTLDMMMASSVPAWDEATLGVGDCSWRFKHVLLSSRSAKMRSKVLPRWLVGAIPR